LSAAGFSSLFKFNGRPAERKPWKPEEHGLSKDFVLTNFSDLKGWGCKVPQPTLMKYLEKIGKGDIISETPDVSVRPIRNSRSKKLISTIDFFYPNVHDPYLQGRISCCNVLSDLFSMAVTDIDVVLMVLAISNRMTETEREVKGIFGIYICYLCAFRYVK
jgi:selenide, water dikinase